MKEKFSKEQIDEMLKNSTEEIVNDNENLVDEFGNVHNADEIIKQAETSISKKYPKVNFRWSEFEIARAKKIAEKLGLPYQTYIKSLIKQGMDKDEKKLKEM
ncbi:MAG: hypothetical protein LUH05_07225 [Candidatus Gastranaerophilales bacterium]|nr:hypothetical protein [Candidatus Gastranaerophilales bacterium]